MSTFNLPNQIMTLLHLLCYTPYIIYWLAAFMVNIFWLTCMFHIVYKSNIYMLINNEKYIDCALIIGCQIYYLYGVLTWNPLIICILIAHSLIIDYEYATTMHQVFNRALETLFNTEIIFVYRKPEQDAEHREPEQDAEHREPEQDAEHREPEQDAEHREPEQDAEHREPEQDAEHREPEQNITDEEALNAMYDEMNGNV